jgi:hypothetical protein
MATSLLLAILASTRVLRRYAVHDAQREKLCVLVYHALSEIRVLCWQTQPEQAADIADAFPAKRKDSWPQWMRSSRWAKTLQATDCIVGGSNLADSATESDIVRGSPRGILSRMALDKEMRQLRDILCRCPESSALRGFEEAPDEMLEIFVHVVDDPEFNFGVAFGNHKMQ